MKLRPALLDRLIAWSPVLLLGAFAVLTYWLNAQIQVGNQKFDGSGRHDPDLYIENFKAVSLDTQGRVQQGLTARVARHFPDDDTTEFDTPLITFNDPNKPQLTVTADRAPRRTGWRTRPARRPPRPRPAPPRVFRHR